MSKKQKVRSFSKRLTRWISISQFIVMGLAIYFIYDLAKGIIMMEESDLYKSYLSYTNSYLSGMLSDVSVAATNHVSEIEENLDRPDKMTAIMKQVVEQNPRIHSCGISFVADYYPQKGRWFCPYAVKDEDGKIKERIVGDASYDYLMSEWFNEALQADSCYWSKPFFGDGDTLRPQVSYLMPIHDKRGKTVAILGADLSLDWFKGKLIRGMNLHGDSINVYVGNRPRRDRSDNGAAWLNLDRKWRSIYSNFIIDDNGTFIAHPDSSYIIKENYFEHAKETTDTIDDHVGHLMVAGEKGFYGVNNLMPDPVDFFDSEGMSVYMFYEPIPQTNWSIASVVPRYMIDAFSIGLTFVLIFLMAIALLITRIVGRFVIKRATKPLTQLAESAKEVAKGNFKTPLPKIKHNDEIRLLRDSFEGMQHSLTEYIEELKDTTASKAAIENELKVAHNIQMSMLPKTFPPYPERDDIDIFGTLTPAKDVGGDLFDFYIRNEKLFFCIGDVSGKGVPASLVMAVTRSLFRNISSHLTEPDQIVKALNDTMADGNETSMFVTLFLGVLDLPTGLLHYCNAGHNSPLLIGSDVSQLPCNPNLPIGVMTDWVFISQEKQLKSQETIFLYTDGLNEAEDGGHAQFGDDRIIRVANICLAEGQIQPTTFVNRMTEAVHRFVDGAEQSDDLTMLAIKYK